MIIIGRVAAVGSLAATVFAANWALVRFGIVPIGFGLAAPAGVYFAGLAFTVRDLIHTRFGRPTVAAAIAAGGVASAVVDPTVALASAAAFLASELFDWSVYEPMLRRGWLPAIVVSNIVGALADSVLFLLLAFGSLDFLAGQLVGKAYATAAAVLVLIPIRRRRAAARL